MPSLLGSCSKSCVGFIQIELGSITEKKEDGNTTAEHRNKSKIIFKMMIFRAATLDTYLGLPRPRSYQTKFLYLAILGFQSDQFAATWSGNPLFTIKSRYNQCI